MLSMVQASSSMRMGRQVEELWIHKRLEGAQIFVSLDDSNLDNRKV